jgi:hypothetical protein
LNAAKIVWINTLSGTLESGGVRFEDSQNADIAFSLLKGSFRNFTRAVGQLEWIHFGKLINAQGLVF